MKLGPGLLSNIYDGIQRPLELLKKKSGAFIGKGIVAEPLTRTRNGSSSPGKEIKKGAQSRRAT